MWNTRARSLVQTGSNIVSNLRNRKLCTSAREDLTAHGACHEAIDPDSSIPRGTVRLQYCNMANCVIPNFTHLITPRDQRNNDDIPKLRANPDVSGIGVSGDPEDFWALRAVQ